MYIFTQFNHKNTKPFYDFDSYEVSSFRLHKKAQRYSPFIWFYFIFGALLPVALPSGGHYTKQDHMKLSPAWTDVWNRPRWEGPWGKVLKLD